MNLEKYQKQNKAWKKMIKSISYKDKGEVFRKNMFWRIQGRVEIINQSN